MAVNVAHAAPPSGLPLAQPEGSSHSTPIMIAASKRGDHSESINVDESDEEDMLPAALSRPRAQDAAPSASGGAKGAIFTPTASAAATATAAAATATATPFGSAAATAAAPAGPPSAKETGEADCLICIQLRTADKAAGSAAAAPLKASSTEQLLSRTPEATSGSTAGPSVGLKAGPTAGPTAGLKAVGQLMIPRSAG